jgi:hypothetical protein
MKHKRLILGSIFLLLLFSLMLYYYLDYNTHDPDTQYIFDHSEQFIGTSVMFTEKITNVDRVNNTFFIQLGSSPESVIRITTTENLSRVQKGDTVEVYGMLTSRNTMTAETLLISEQWNNNLIYIRSLPAIPFALYLFFRTWRLNRKTLHFERRQKHG